MWLLKASFKAEASVVGNLATKHSVFVHLYPMLSNRVAGLRSVSVQGVVSGKPQDCAQFLHNFSALPQIKNITAYHDHFVCEYLEKEGYDSFYNPEVFYLEPWLVNGKTGMHHLHLGSWNKEHLTALYDTLRAGHQGAILKISKGKPPSMFLFTLFPRLTTKQRDAIELAITHGYYDYPRKIDVQDLAKLAKLAFSTFQAHLRKAEKKLIPSSLKSAPGDTYR